MDGDGRARASGGAGCLGMGGWASMGRITPLVTTAVSKWSEVGGTGARTATGRRVANELCVVLGGRHGWPWPATAEACLSLFFVVIGSALAGYLSK